MQEADAVSASAPVTPVAEDATSKAAAPIALHSSHERTMATLDAMDAQVEASLSGLSAEKQVAELRAQLRAVEVKRREQVASSCSTSCAPTRARSGASHCGSRSPRSSSCSPPRSSSSCVHAPSEPEAYTPDPGPDPNPNP